VVEILEIDSEIKLDFFLLPKEFGMLKFMMSGSQQGKIMY
jgi:hypothetical protein